MRGDRLLPPETAGLRPDLEVAAEVAAAVAIHLGLVATWVRRDLEASEGAPVDFHVTGVAWDDRVAAALAKRLSTLKSERVARVREKARADDSEARSARFRMRS